MQQENVEVEFLVGYRYWLKKHIQGNTEDAENTEDKTHAFTCFIKLKDPYLEKLTHKLIQDVSFESLHEETLIPHVRTIKSKPDKPL